MTEFEIEDHFFKILNLVSKRRISRIIMYSLLTIGSVISFFAPSQVLLAQTSPAVTAIWSLGFCFAASVSLLGSIRDRLLYEYASLPMLSSTLAVFGIAMIGQSSSEEKLLLIPYACLFWGFALMLYMRWKDVHILVKAAEEVLPDSGGRT